MKIKKFLSLLLLAFVAICLVACGDDEVDEENVNEVAQGYLDTLKVTAASGETLDQVTQNITLGSCTVDGVTIEWTSDNTNVISNTGKVTRGEKDTKVKLTVKLTYKDVTLTKSFDVTVKAKEVEIILPLNIELSGDAKMAIGETYQLTATVKPDNAQDKSIKWASDNESVATVDQDGKVTTKAAGSATITATANADQTVKGTFAITVLEPSADTIAKTLAKEKGAEGWVKGTVVGVYAQGYYLYDGTGYILVYLGKDAKFDQKMGDYVEVKGILDQYNGANQFTSSATITPLTEGTDYKLNATTMDDAQVLALMANVEVCKKIKISVKITSASASYVNATVVDGTAAISICYPVDYTVYEVDQEYDLTCLALYAKEYQSRNTLYVMAEKATKIDHGYDVNITYQDGESKDIVKINSLEFPIFELKTPEAKDGKVFLGWYKGTEEKPIKVNYILAPEDTTVFARWADEKDAPLIVNPEAEEGSGQYKSISDAIAAAEEGATIELLAGEYTEEVTVLAERTYANMAAVASDFIADFSRITGKTIDEPAKMDTNYMDTVDITNFWANAEMKTKWLWLFKGLYEIAEYPENCDPETADFTNATVKQFFIANLCGLFTGTIHTDTVTKKVSYDWTNAKLITKVLAYCDKKDPIAEDSVTEKIIIDKAVTIIGPNMNVHGHSEERNDEAIINCAVEIKANNVTINGVAFLASGTIGIGADYLTLENCYIKTEKWINYGADNRKGCIANMAYKAVGFKMVDTYICTPGTSYNNEAIAIDGTGMEDITITGCYFENEASATASYECIMAYRLYGKFIFTNNECYFPTTGYFARLGLYGATMTEVLVQDNIFSGVGDLCSATFAFPTLTDNGCTIDIIHNQFLNFAPTTIITKGGTTNKINILYNYFDERQEFKVQNAGVMNFDYNCVLGAKNADSQVDPASQTNNMATLEALEAAYAIYAAEINRTATVTLDTDGGDALDPIVFKKAKDVVLPTPTKAGYAFLGWFDGESEVKEISEKKDITLKAHWIKVNKVTFDVDGGEAIDPIEFTDYTKVILPETTKDGVAFLGWYDGDNLVTELTENKDYALKAKFGDAKKITFDTDGGDEIKAIYYTDYAKVELPTPKKDGFVFDGWYNGESLVTTLTENSDITLKAKWLVAYTVSFDTDNGYALEALIYTDYTKVVLPKAAKDNMFFKAWMEGESEFAGLTENKNITLKATYYTFAEKIASLQEGDTVEFAAGTYTSTEAIVISVNNVKFVGVDKDSQFDRTYVYDETAPHSVLNACDIQIAEGVKGFTMEGIVLTGKSHLVGLKACEDVTLKNNIIYNIGTLATGDSTSDGVIYFANVKNMVITGNVITGTDASARIFRFKVVENLEFTSNVFADSFAGYSGGAGGDLLRIDDGGALKGVANISDNIFQNATQVAIHTRPLTDVTYISNNNYFKNCDGCYWLRNYTGTVYVVITHNFIEGGGSGWDLIGSNAGYAAYIVKYNYFKTLKTGDGCYHVLGSGATGNYVSDNYFAGDANVKLNGALQEEVSKLTDAKAVAFIGNSEFDSWAVGGVEDLYFTTPEKVSASEAVAADTKVVYLPGEYKGGEFTKQVEVTSIMEGFSVLENKELYKAVSPKLVGALSFNQVLTPKVHHLAITKGGQIYTLACGTTNSSATKDTYLDNIYAYDSVLEDVKAYACNGILNNGANSTSTKFAVIQLQGLYSWVKGGQLTNSCFENLRCGAFFAVCGDGFTFDNNEFIDVDYDAITFRYASGTGNTYNITNCKFENIGANGFYIRSATGSYTYDLVVNMSDCSFKNIGCKANDYATETSIHFGCIATRGYGEKKSCTFNITHCTFEKSVGYICIRDNATTTETWRAKGLKYDVNVTYCTFLLNSDTEKISASWVGTDSATTNVGDFNFNNNYYYYMSEGEAPVATVAHPTYDDILETSNTVVYESVAALEEAYAATKIENQPA